jgi:hypothetical protein
VSPDVAALVPVAPIVLPTPAPPVAAVSKLQVSPSAVRTIRQGAHRAGANVSYTLNVGASVRFTIQRRSTGRKVKHAKKTTCDRLSKGNRAKAKCVRYTSLQGAFTRTGHVGSNTFRFTGRLSGKRLARGSYRLVALPTVNRKSGRADTVAFRIVR